MQFQHLYKQITAQSSVFYAWFEAMYTRIDIILSNVEEESATSLTKDIYAEINRLEQISNRFDPQSEISKVNQIASIEPVYINIELYSILKDCIEQNRTTLGAFDITVQSFNDYRYGINDIVLDPAATTVFFKNKNVQLDLCGYIKGYALNKVKNMLIANHCRNALINFGNSSIYALGNHPNGSGWKVNIPGHEKKYTTLSNQCLTNSGNTTNHLHIIQPKSGEFSKPNETISVITENAKDGEVLSTSLCVCDPKHKDFICAKLGGKLPQVELYC